MIDPEFATYGPFGFDIGQFIANLLLNALSREEEQRGVLFFHIEKTWSYFVETFTKLWIGEGVEAYTKERAMATNYFAKHFYGCRRVCRM